MYTIKPELISLQDAYTYLSFEGPSYKALCNNARSSSNQSRFSYKANASVISVLCLQNHFKKLISYTI